MSWTELMSCVQLKETVMTGHREDLAQTWQMACASHNSYRLGFLGLMLTLLLTVPASADIFVQCPGDTDGDAEIDDWDDPILEGRSVRCMHAGAGDGFVNMSDVRANPTLDEKSGRTRGRHQYMFGFTDLTGHAPEDVMNVGFLDAKWPAPTIILEENDEFFLSLSNMGMVIRPDLDDPHTVHYHGYPGASGAFDGVPENTLSIHMVCTFTYYYNQKQPGTFMWHCHVEASEHMQMGMIGHLYVHAAQDKTEDGHVFENGFIHHTGQRYAYNDGDGSSAYDVEKPLLILSFDPEFHDASENTQPLPFADMKDTYWMLNGRGYPETTIEANLPNTRDGRYVQNVDSMIRANKGEKILLRVVNSSITDTVSIQSPSIPMKVVGAGASLMRGPCDPTDELEGHVLVGVTSRDCVSGKDIMFMATTLSVAGGHTWDLILDTTNVAPGKYFLYTTNYQYLSNNTEDQGGVMTEIVIN